MAISQQTPTAAQLRAYIAVSEYLHFRKAAAALGTSQPSLSAALAGCEQALGTQLVERTTRRVMLTEAGVRLLPRARAVLAAMDDLVAAAGTTRAPFSSTVHFGVIPTIAPYVLPMVLLGLSKLYPTLPVEVHEDRTADLLSSLADGTVDLALLATPVEQPGLVVTDLYDEDFVLVAPRGHELAAHDVVGMEALRELDVLLLEEGHCLRDQTMNLCAEVGANAASRAAGLTTLVQLVSAGIGATVLPETAVSVEVGRARLTVNRFAPPTPRRRIRLVYRDSSGRSTEYAAIADEIRRVLRTRRFPVQLIERAE